jgi:hypothetical protein
VRKRRGIRGRRGWLWIGVVSVGRPAQLRRRQDPEDGGLAWEGNGDVARCMCVSVDFLCPIIVMTL